MNQLLQIESGTTSPLKKRLEVRYALVALCCAAQTATIAITWPLWQVREATPNLPLLGFPAMDFGWIVLASLLVALINPSQGLPFHLFVLAVSIAFDQFRLQPQVLGIAILLTVVVYERARDAGRWYLAAMWLWAGLHKLIADDWFAQESWSMLTWLGLAQDAWHGPLAYSVALGEIVLGLLAVLRPKWAAVGCIVLHTGIAVLFSPLFANRNQSVIPWNVALAVVGPWILWHVKFSWTRSWAYWAIAAVILLSPTAYYFGMLPRAFAHTLYSGNVPRGLITDAHKLTPIEGSAELEVPFPYSRRLLRKYFEQSATPGSKLHITGPQPLLVDAYFVKRPDGSSLEISRERFLASTNDEVAGIEQDSPRSIFYLAKAGARLLRRTPDSMVYAVQIPPDRYKPQLLTQLRGLPNVEQLQLEGCSVSDDHLCLLQGCHNLLGIGLNATDVTDDGIRSLMSLPRLHYFELEDTNTSLALRSRLGL